jgi:hypothetical protein
MGGVAINSALQVGFMLRPLLSCYHRVVQDFRLGRHSLTSATLQSLVDQCLAYDEDPWKGPIGKDGKPVCTPSANAAGGGNGSGNPYEAIATCSFNYHMSRWRKGCKDGSEKCMVCHNTSNKPPHHSANCPILNKIGLKLVKHTPADGGAASCVGKEAPPPGKPAAAPVPAPPMEAGSGGSVSTPGAFPAITELDTYDSGYKFDYKGKYEGKVYQDNSANPQSNVSLYPSTSHAITKDPISDSTSADNPDLGILSPSTICHHSTSIDLKGFKTIQLPKLVLVLLNNPPGHLTAFAFLKSWPATSLLVVDTGTTNHIILHKSAFISYKPANGRHIRMGNNLFAPILGTSSAIISINR